MDIDILWAFVVGLIFGVLLMLVCDVTDISSKQVATQICEYLDTGLLEYETTYDISYNFRIFKYIKCGEPKPEPTLIEGLDSEKLIEVLG